MLGILGWGGWQVAGRGRGLQEVLPFGSFLAVGAIGCLWFGQPVLDWYKSLLTDTMVAALTVLS